MNDSIFKAYDVRGRYPNDLDESTAFAIGWGFARSGLVDLSRPVVVGRDMRESGKDLSEALSLGLTAAGAAVIEIGLSTTPMFYFAVVRLGAGGGIMVTASHNPGEYNGFKFVRELSIPISSDTGLLEIRERSKEAPAWRAGRGTEQAEVDLTREYVGFYEERFAVSLDREVVIDAGNGMAGAILPRVLSTQKIRHEDLFFELDGRFPHHEANPLKEESHAFLRRAMAERPGSIGVSFDGDGDRVAFLDETGELIRGDLLTALIAGRLLRKNGGGTVIYDLRCSRAVAQAVRALGGRPIKSRVGHSFIKALMRKEDALFGGELSYHFYFREFFYCESGILAMLHVLSALEESGGTLAELVSPLRIGAHSGEINFPVPDMKGAMDRVEALFPDAETSHLDGLSVEYPSWWFNLRPSNTERLLRLNLEAETEEQMKKQVARLAGVLRRER